MRAADLDIHELLHFVPAGGHISFAGDRVLLLDGALPKHFARDSRGTARTTGAPRERACIRSRVSYARR